MCIVKLFETPKHFWTIGDFMNKLKTFKNLRYPCWDPRFCSQAPEPLGHVVLLVIEVIFLHYC